MRLSRSSYASGVWSAFVILAAGCALLVGACAPSANTGQSTRASMDRQPTACGDVLCETGSHCSPDEECVSDEICDDYNPCYGGQDCVQGQCIDSQTSASGCQSYDEYGACVNSVPCGEGPPCAFGEVCSSGLCVPQDNSASFTRSVCPDYYQCCSNNDCGRGYVCADDHTCVDPCAGFAGSQSDCEALPNCYYTPASYTRNASCSLQFQVASCYGNNRC
jgi:hypothetical protein